MSYNYSFQSSEGKILALSLTLNNQKLLSELRKLVEIQICSARFKNCLKLHLEQQQKILLKLRLSISFGLNRNFEKVDLKSFREKCYRMNHGQIVRLHVDLLMSNDGRFLKQVQRIVIGHSKTFQQVIRLDTWSLKSSLVDLQETETKILTALNWEYFQTFLKFLYLLSCSFITFSWKDSIIDLSAFIFAYLFLLLPLKSLAAWVKFQHGPKMTFNYHFLQFKCIFSSSHYWFLLLMAENIILLLPHLEELYHRFLWFLLKSKVPHQRNDSQVSLKESLHVLNCLFSIRIFWERIGTRCENWMDCKICS